jgi:hypothetical protein
MVSDYSFDIFKHFFWMLMQNSIFQLYCPRLSAFFLWWRKRKKTTPLPQVTVKLYHTIVFSTRHAGKQTRFYDGQTKRTNNDTGNTMVKRKGQIIIQAIRWSNEKDK